MPVVIPPLTKLGIIDKVKEPASLNRDAISWRSLDGKELAHLPLGSSNPDDFGGVLLFGQYKISNLLLEELKNYLSMEARFGLRYGGVDDSPEADHVKVLVHSRALGITDQVLEANYVVAADGANSIVRRSLCILMGSPTPTGR